MYKMNNSFLADQNIPRSTYLEAGIFYTQLGMDPVAVKLRILLS